MAFVGSGFVAARRGAFSGAKLCTNSNFLGQGVVVNGRARVAVARSMTTMSADLSGLREKLMKLYDETPCQPIMVRLAWHDAGTYDKDSDKKGPDASIRFKPESEHGANAGLKWAMDKLEEFKTSDISYADLYQYASVIAIEHAGGPKIPFKLGRTDASEAECTPDGRLPAADKGMGHLRDIFYRMGFNDEEIVALSGAHTIGKAHKDRSGFEGPWTHEMYKFDNSYFVELVKDNPDPALLKLETDLALMSQESTKALCELYAKDQSKFFDDYSKAHVKLSELGWNL